MEQNKNKKPALCGNRFFNCYYKLRLCLNRITVYLLHHSLTPGASGFVC